MIHFFRNILFLFLIHFLFISPVYSIESRAKAAYVEDAVSNTVLFEKNSHVPYGPASMSKLMLIYIVFENLQNGTLNLQQEFLVSKKAWKFGGSKMFVNFGDKVSIDDLLKGVVIQSGNDACIVLAEGMSGSEDNMVDEMNSKAMEMGLQNTNFTNVTGWPENDHYMSVRDIGHLSKLIIKRFPEYYYYFSLTEYTYNDIKQYNRNRLINIDGYDGLKTGRTTQAGFGLAASKIKNNRRIISVVNGLNSDRERINETKKLVNWGFREFKNIHLYDEEDAVVSAKVWLGKKSFVSLVVNNDLNVTIPRKNIGKFQVKAIYDSPIPAPIKKGDQLGKLIVFNGEFDITHPLFAGEDVKNINRLSRSFSIINYLFFGVGSTEANEKR